LSKTVKKAQKELKKDQKRGFLVKIDIFREKEKEPVKDPFFYEFF
jgi:hypothetical protein